MKLPRSLLGRFGLFTALGLIDLALTCYLLRAAPGQVYEGNPVARWWLLAFGFMNNLMVPAAYCYAPEVYPTSLRGTGFGWASTASRSRASR